MEDKKTIIDKIKEMVFAEEAPVNEEETAVLDIKADDGSILRIEGETLEEGVAISIVTEEGVEPIPSAEYIIEEGTKKITTDEDSKVASIEEVVEESEEEMNAEETEEVVEEEMKAEDAEPSMEDRMKLIEEALDAINEKFSKVETGINEMTEKVKAISDEPAEEEIKIKKTGFAATKAKREDALDAIAKFRNK